MRTYAVYTDIARATERLHGILSGISLDYKLNDVEIGRLYDWLQMHQHLCANEPFYGIANILNRALADSVIDEDEREEILQWCVEMEKAVPDCVTTAIRRLHGVLHGLAIDGRVSVDELVSLKDWLLDYEIFKHHWPFCETWDMLNRILADGKIDTDEKAEVIAFCKHFSEERVQDPKIHDEFYEKPWMISPADVLQPFTALCDRNCAIRFADRRFCFTGPARSGPRHVLAEMVLALNGDVRKNVVPDLDYLVIGAQSSPAWAYSTYGRKIERVIEYRKQGARITILHEDDFVKQTREYL